MAEKKNVKSIKVLFREIFTNKSVLFALLLTIFLLIIFHFASIITTPGIELPKNYQEASTSFSGMLNLLAGGGLSKMSLFAVGVGPYITAQIIVQLLSSDLIPPMARMAKAGERGKRKLEIITRVLTLPFCIAQSYAVLALLFNSKVSGSNVIKVFGHDSLGDLTGGEVIALMTIFTAGTYIAIFIGDMITKRGVGNGITLLILAGIVSSIISNFQMALITIKGDINPDQANYVISVVLSFGLYILFFIGILLAVIFINDSNRKIPIQQTGQGLTTDIENLPFLPIKLNSAGVIPVIFASSIMTIPGTVAQFLTS
jgi:preprotein translocase subunit SecY